MHARRRRRATARLPTCHELLCAPELAILAALESSLDIACVAVVAAQPELHSNPHGHDAVSTPAALAADHFLACVRTLAAAIGDYRATLRDSPQDLPF
jgi:hypothetical protein